VAEHGRQKGSLCSLYKVAAVWATTVAVRGTACSRAMTAHWIEEVVLPWLGTRFDDWNDRRGGEPSGSQ
jgi:hypothetical protein